MTGLPPLDAAILPAGIRARIVQDVNGLDVHVLEAGFERDGRPAVLLLHGFPELAYSWRKVMLPLAGAGFHVIAPDQRGYGRTTGWDGDYDGDLGSFRMLNLVQDALSLLFALGHTRAAVIGHDFGSPVAAWCALVRPDVFHAVVLMSAPFAGPPALPFATAGGAAPPAADGPARPAVASPTARSGREGAAETRAQEAPMQSARAGTMDDALAALQPSRKHYQRYYASREANADMLHCSMGVHAFLRAYFHVKSGDWTENRPQPLLAWTAEELARLPDYYVMPRAADMPGAVAPHLPDAAAIAACRWLPEEELAVYSAEFERTGFQGGLQWYRCATDRRLGAELRLFARRKLEVPACFVAGARDWGIHQQPGALLRMRATCTQLRGSHLVDGAGHWVQQERPDAVTRLLLEFLHGVPSV
jgi:pimeloyl-ACP methyl ester carboxylesterase